MIADQWSPEVWVGMGELVTEGLNELVTSLYTFVDILQIVHLIWTYLS